MRTINITEARKDIFNLAEQAKNASSPLLVVNSRGDNFVVISEEDWIDIQETLYLSSIPGLNDTIKKAKEEDYTNKKAYNEDEKW